MIIIYSFLLYPIRIDHLIKKYKKECIYISKHRLFHAQIKDHFIALPSSDYIIYVYLETHLQKNQITTIRHATIVSKDATPSYALRRKLDYMLIIKTLTYIIFNFHINR